jgi:hypothetical protein
MSEEEFKIKIEKLKEIEMQNCNRFDNKNAIINCKFGVLHAITEIQDYVNLDIRKTLDNDRDKRWYPIHIIDDANAMILGISRAKGIPRTIFIDKYVEDKFYALHNKWDKFISLNNDEWSVL